MVEKCNGLELCLGQVNYRLESFGKIKVTVEGTKTFCFFCKCDFRHRQYLENMRLK